MQRSPKQTKDETLNVPEPAAVSADPNDAPECSDTSTVVVIVVMVVVVVLDSASGRCGQSLAGALGFAGWI